MQAFAPSRNSGIGFEGKNGDKFNWGFGWYYDANDFGVSTDEDNTNLTGRIAFRPYYEDGNLFHIGLGATFKDRASSIRFRARPENHIGGRLVDTGNFAADSADIFNVELATVAGPFWASAEYFTADVSTPGGNDPSFDGAYVQAGYFLTGESRAFKTSSGGFDRMKPPPTSARARRLGTEVPLLHPRPHRRRHLRRRGGQPLGRHQLVPQPGHPHDDRLRRRRRRQRGRRPVLPHALAGGFLIHACKV